MLTWLRPIAALLIATLPLQALGQASTIERHYTGKPQTSINVGIFSSISKNCTPGALPAVRLVSPPAHGKVTVKSGTLHARNFRQCLATDLPALIAFYRSNPNFAGDDNFTIQLVEKDGKSQLQRITVTIKGANQQGI